jgi:hypothetical protein
LVKKKILGLIGMGNDLSYTGLCSVKKYKEDIIISNRELVYFVLFYIDNNRYVEMKTVDSNRLSCNVLVKDCFNYDPDVYLVGNEETYVITFHDSSLKVENIVSVLETQPVPQKLELVSKPISPPRQPNKLSSISPSSSTPTTNLQKRFEDNFVVIYAKNSKLTITNFKVVFEYIQKESDAQNRVNDVLFKKTIMRIRDKLEIKQPQIESGPFVSSFREALKNHTLMGVFIQVEGIHDKFLKECLCKQKVSDFLKKSFTIWGLTLPEFLFIYFYLFIFFYYFIILLFYFSRKPSLTSPYNLFVPGFFILCGLNGKTHVLDFITLDEKLLPYGLIKETDFVKRMNSNVEIFDKYKYSFNISYFFFFFLFFFKSF